MLAGLGQSLERYPRFEIVFLDPSGGNTLLELDALCPAAVVCDLSLVPTDSALSLLDGRSDLLLIGLDPGGNGLVVLSGQHARMLTAVDLAQLIERTLSGDQGGPASESTYSASERSEDLKH